MEQHICSCTHKKPITGKYDCLAYVRGNVAYALDALPQTHVEITTGLPWAQNVIYLCTQHHRMFCQGKALHLSYSIPDQLYIEINNVQEDSMNQPIIPFRLCCGQQHLGNVCPDNTIMCGICFGKFTAEQWDNEIGCCKECAKDQTMTIKQMRENNMSSIIYIQTEFFGEDTGNSVIQRIMEAMNGLLVSDEIKVYAEIDMNTPGSFFGEMAVYLAFETIASLDESVAAMRRHGDIRLKDWGTMDKFLSMEEFYAMLDSKWAAFDAQYNAPKEDIMNTDQTIPTYGPEMNDVNAPFITTGEMRINNERIENNFPKSWPELEGDLTKLPGYAKCSACSKEIGEDWYHPVQLIRTCAGAQRLGEFTRVFNETTLNYDYVSPAGYKAIFDTSREAIIARAKDLAAKGCTNVKVGKSTKGKKNWYVSYRES